MKIIAHGLSVVAVAAIFTGCIVVDAEAAARKAVSFPSGDGLKITAELYGANLKAGSPIIVTFHQARSSRGEYATIAPKLNALGYRVLAPDQRSGNIYDGIKNETAARAKTRGLAVKYRDALPDLVATIAFAKKLDPTAPIILWGSSYSASLVLKLAARPGIADAALAFSPGEYFGGTWIGDTAGKISIPTFVTSARGEADRWKGIFKKIGTVKKTSFIPKVKGRHGSSALHPSQGDQATPYWRAIKDFLQAHAPVG